MEAKFGAKGKRSTVMLRSHVCVLAVAAIVALAPAAALAGGGSGPAGPSKAVKFEDVPGSNLKRVILTERAAERLGIGMGEVYETTIVRTQMVGGRIVPPPEDEAVATASSGGFAGFAQPASVGGQIAQPTGTAAETAVQRITSQGTPLDLRKAWVLVTLSPDEWERTRQDKPARILRLQTRVGEELQAQPTGEPREDPKRTMLSAYYEIPGEDHGLLLHERVRVELELTDSDQTRKVVPYEAVYYDGAGMAWVYSSPEPLVYVRMPIEIERIEGGLAVLNDGPPLGTKVVTTGAPLLYGAEVIYKR